MAASAWASRPTEITLLQTIQLTEENFALAECFEDGADCPLIGECDLNGALREALGAFFTVLQGYTIADLAHKKRSLRERLGLRPGTCPNSSTPTKRSSLIIFTRRACCPAFLFIARKDEFDTHNKI